MADLDKIVRPFQLRQRDSALAEKVLEVRKPGTPVTLHIGKSGSGKQINGSLSIDLKSFKGQMVEEEKEGRR